MITLYGFGPRWGLPDPSPFVMKAEVLLKMAEVPYRKEIQPDPRKAPKGKLPYIDEGGTLVPDSTFIRFLLEDVHGIDFDRGLDPRERAIAWAAEKLAEDQLYWAMVYARWMDDANFDRGPRAFFDVAPAPLRPLVVRLARGAVKRDLHGQGFGRHSPEEVDLLARRSMEAIADLIGDGPYLCGVKPSGADASVFAIVASILCPVFEWSIREAFEADARLVGYRDRLMKQFFPEVMEVA